MPNDTSFAVMYKKLVDRNFDPDPEKITRTRRNLMGQIFAQGSPEKEKQVWTKQSDCGRIHSEFVTGEEMK